MKSNKKNCRLKFEVKTKIQPDGEGEPSTSDLLKQKENIVYGTTVFYIFQEKNEKKLRGFDFLRKE